ncbi:MAG: hypothetical protein R3D00_20770 [Bacteroidia bacterium]
MEKYINAGYFLIKSKLLRFGTLEGTVVKTCSGCINTSAFDIWCLSWVKDALNEESKLELGLSDSQINDIHKWTDIRFDRGELGFGNVFPDLETARTFKELFFAGRNDIEMLGLYLPQTDADRLTEDFKEGNNSLPFNQNNGKFGLRLNLLKQIEEKETEDAAFLGYDFIGVEGDGSFHSFYCHNITEILIDMFALTLNENGLFEEITQPDQIREYLNSPNAGVEPVPWYIAKVKRITT